MMSNGFYCVSIVSHGFCEFVNYFPKVFKGLFGVFLINYFPKGFGGAVVCCCGCRVVIVAVVVVGAVFFLSVLFLLVLSSQSPSVASRAQCVNHRH